MLDGLADMYEQLQTQIGLPNDACATSEKSSAAQLRIKLIRIEKRDIHSRN